MTSHKLKVSALFTTLMVAVLAAALIPTPAAGERTGASSASSASSASVVFYVY